jgi:hypothetical protein
MGQPGYLFNPSVKLQDLPMWKNGAVQRLHAAMTREQLAAENQHANGGMIRRY